MNQRPLGYEPSALLSAPPRCRVAAFNVQLDNGYSCAGDWNRTNDLEGYEYTPLRALTICATPTKVAAFNVQLDNTGGWVRTNVL